MTQPPGPGQFPPAAPAPTGEQLQPYGVPFTPPPVPPPPAEAQWRPARVDPVDGTDYAVVQIEVAPVASGLATGALIAGVASILVSVLVFCFGAAGSSDGWGGWVAGAFTLLAVLIGGGAVTVGLIATRQIRRSGQDGKMRFTGRSTAIAGVSCGAAGAGIALVALALTLVLQLS
jgi:hypothetical protein